MMRLFIAVNISEENKNRIARIQSKLKDNIAGVKWVEKENLHLTLKFLGEVAGGRLAEIKEKIAEAGSLIKRFEIDFCNLGIFPNENFPRILWAGIEKGQPELEVLARKIEDLLQEIGFEKEKRPFSAHLTIGRFKNHRPCSLHGKNKEEKFSQTVEKIFLIKSTLTPKGPVYEVVEKFQLEGK